MNIRKLTNDKVSLKPIRETPVGNQLYFTNLGVKKITSGYCIFGEYCGVFAPGALLINGGGSTSIGTYTLATDAE